MSLEEQGNTVTLINKSSIPAHISYFDLAWVEKRTLFGLKIPFNGRSSQENLHSIQVTATTV